MIQDSINEDLNKSFPKDGDPSFMNIVSSNWEALQKGNFKGSVVAPWLYRYLKPKRSALCKVNVFIIYLLLCLDRPWEKNWKFSLSEKRFKDRLIIRSYEIMDRLNISYPDIPQGLNRRLKKNQKNIEKAIYGLPLSRLELTLGALLKPIRIKIGIALKLCDIMASKKFVLKRDLQRKFWRDKKQLTFLLENWEEDGDIKQKKFPGGSTWIFLNEKTSK